MHYKLSHHLTFLGDSLLSMHLFWKICFDKNEYFYQLGKHFFFTNNTFPPPNNGRNTVEDVVPIPRVRSINIVANSPTRTIIVGSPNDLTNVNWIPIQITKVSHLVAYRY